MTRTGSPPTDRERRSVTLSQVDVREAGATGFTFAGHAVVFNQRTRIGGERWGFLEMVAPEALDGALTRPDDVRLLVDHDPSKLLARTASGTLRLTRDAHGLVVNADLDGTDPDVASVVPKMRRGDLDGMSFAFTIESERWQILPAGDRDAGEELRTILSVNPLWDVSVTTYPAYTGTDAALRAYEARRRAGLTSATNPLTLLAGARRASSPNTVLRRMLHA